MLWEIQNIIAVPFQEVVTQLSIVRFGGLGFFLLYFFLVFWVFCYFVWFCFSVFFVFWVFFSTLFLEESVLHLFSF